MNRCVTTLGRIILITLMCAVVLLAAGCGKPSTTQLADRMVDSMAKGDFTSATKDFNANMNSLMSAGRLSQTWAQLTAQAGAFKSHIESREAQEADSKTVSVTCQFEKAPIDIKVAFDKDGKIGGLYFLPHVSATNAEKEDQPLTRAIVNALENSNMALVQNLCGGGLQQKSATWGPAITNALNQQFGRSKSISFISSGVPAKGWIEQVWDVQAERKNYQIRVQYLSGKIRHMEFRSSSNQPWTHVMEIASGQTIK